jgi:hypothetical protein
MPNRLLITVTAVAIVTFGGCGGGDGGYYGGGGGAGWWATSGFGTGGGGGGSSFVERGNWRQESARASVIGQRLDLHIVVNEIILK